MKSYGALTRILIWLGGSLPIVACSLLQAQSVTQTIQGLVSDASSAVVPGATVTITNVSTGIETTLLTNETGYYSFQLVPVGTYNVTCRMEGFQSAEAKSLRVETASQVRQDFVLQLGEQTTSIEVVASNVALQTENPSLGTVIGNRSVVELPLNGRNMVNLAVLTPGVQFGFRTGLGSGDGTFPVPGAGFSVSANGVREIHQVVSLDGVDAKDPRTHRTTFVPSVEAVEEFKIQTNAYSAEIGFGGGAVVNVTMKSGANELHGTLFHFLRHERLDAEDYFLNLGLAPGEERSPKDRFRRNQFGLVASGPIVRNQTFWAFNWESRIDRRQLVDEGWYPLDEFREGDFSELLTGTIHPETGQVFRSPIVVYDPFTGEPFSDNKIPSSRFHPGIVNNILPNYMPRASFRQTDPLDFTDRWARETALDSNQYYGRIDQHFSNMDRIFGRIALVRSSIYSEVFPITTNPDFPGRIDSRQYNIASQWVHAFRHDLINEFRFGFNTTIDFLSSIHTNDESFDIEALGIGEYRVVFDGNRKLTPLEQGLPSLIGRWPRFRDAAGSDDRSDSCQFGNHVSWMAGAHNLKMGYEFHRLSLRRHAGGQPDVRFSDAETGFDFAAMLMGIPTRTVTPIGWPPTFPRANRQGIYIHDDWKVAPKLTLNIGLRFDYNGTPRAAKGSWRTIDFPGEGAAVGRGSGFLTGDGEVIPVFFPEFVDERGAVNLWKQDVRFFMPRAGIAYRPSEKWVLRIGAGYFDNIMHQNNFTILNLQPPKSGSQLFLQRTALAETVPVTAADGRQFSVQTRRFAPGSNPITLDDPFLTRVGGRPVIRPVPTLHIKPDYKDGDIWKWSFDLQRELPASAALTAGYIGSKGSHVANSIHAWNEAAPSLDNNPQSRRPFQRFFDPALPELGVQSLGRVRYLDSFGNSFHHGLQIKLEKRYSKGLSFGLAYTLSKSHGDGEAGGNESAIYQFPRTNRKDARSRYRFDQRHNFVGNFVWELPGNSLPDAWRRVLGGWQANGIVSVRSGFPFSVSQQARDLNLNGDSSLVRPDRVRDGALAGASRARWFDTKAFRRVTCRLPGREDLCHFGSAGLNILNSPGQRNFDLSLYKNIPLSERVKMQFRSEFFNAFNTPYLGQPNAITFTTPASLVPDGPRDAEIRELRTPMRIIQFGLKLFF